jgi:hypothetical protein
MIVLEGYCRFVKTNDKFGENSEKQAAAKTIETI